MAVESIAQPFSGRIEQLDSEGNKYWFPTSYLRRIRTCINANAKEAVESLEWVENMCAIGGFDWHPSNTIDGRLIRLYGRVFISPLTTTSRFIHNLTSIQ